MRAEFLIRLRATWDPNWQNLLGDPVECPLANRYSGPDGMDELLEGIEHDEGCADGHELIVHDIAIDLGHPPRILNNRLEFYILYDVESDEAGSIADLQRITLDGFMFWCEKWIDDMRVEVIEVKHN